MAEEVLNTKVGRDADPAGLGAPHPAALQATCLGKWCASSGRDDGSQTPWETSLWIWWLIYLSTFPIKDTFQYLHILGLHIPHLPSLVTYQIKNPPLENNWTWKMFTVANQLMAFAFVTKSLHWEPKTWQLRDEIRTKFRRHGLRPGHLSWKACGVHF